jgi:hypothetical protein
MIEEEKMEIGLFRYGLIHPLLQEGLPKGEKAALMRQILSKTYEPERSVREIIEMLELLSIDLLNLKQEGLELRHWMN